MTAVPNLRPAADGDGHAIAVLLREAALWLREEGQPLWNPEDFTTKKIEGELPNWRVAAFASEIFGAFKLEEADPFFWPDFPKGEALFLHKLVVKRSQARTHLSTAMLEFAVAETRRRHKAWLRLDCDATRPKLRAVYERFGFRHHSDQKLGSYTAARYEYRISPSP